jgi:hypothetical protein
MKSIIAVISGGHNLTLADFYGALVGAIICVTWSWYSERKK